MNLYDAKDREYFSRARTEIGFLLHKTEELPVRVLEIGCSQGHTLAWLKKEGYCSWTAGVEPYANLHENIKNIDYFYKLDIEKKLPELPPLSIDIILCLDVLEHLNNPWEVIRKLDGLMKPGGQLIISLPNIRNYHVVFDLLFRGNFNYTDSGILDKTHLRFFTRLSAISLAESAGASVNKIIRVDMDRWQKRILSTIGLGDLITKQFLLSATKPNLNQAQSHKII